MRNNEQQHIDSLIEMNSQEYFQEAINTSC